MTLAGLVGYFFTDQVFQHVPSCVEIGQPAEEVAKLLRDEFDVVVVLNCPEPELGTRQPAIGPGK